MPFIFTPTEIPEVAYIEPRVFPDDRGEFSELYKASDFAVHGIPGPFVQVNQSISKQNVLRGLHFQNPPRAQSKIVSVMSGEVFDVAVDIRKGSPTYGKWVGRTLTAEKRNLLYIPAGFAHGFCVLSDSATLTYLCTDEYAPEQEAGIIWSDETIGIAWPVQNPLISEKDAAFPSFVEANNQFEYHE
ncbi:MAG: dTDP-4-dehydrorhamnose 3,5-epimerase [Candidatus Andersenbacteria bacterium]